MKKWEELGSMGRFWRVSWNSAVVFITLPILAALFLPEATIKREAKQTAVAAPVVKELSSITYRDIARSAKKMTELQFDRYADSIEGSLVKWKGKVVDVDRNLFGGYQLRVDMSNTGIQDVYIELGDNEEFALRFNAGQSVTFKGEISNIITFLGSPSITFKAASFGN